MQQSFLSARVGPILGLVGSSIVLIYYFSLPLDSLVSEWDGTPWQGSLDPVVVVVLLAALAVLILSVVALFLPHLPVLGSLGLYAASVGLLAQLYSFFYSFMEFGATLTNLPRLFSFLVSILFAGWWLLLLGFLLSGGAMALTAIKAEQQAGVTLHRDHQPAFPGTEQHANETPARERGGRQSIQEVDEKESVWSLDQRHILAMIVGVLLYSVLSNLSILWEGPGEANIVAVSPAVILVLFFGIVYGPWVGLVTGGIGSFLYNAHQRPCPCSLLDTQQLGDAERRPPYYITSSRLLAARRRERCGWLDSWSTALWRSRTGQDGSLSPGCDDEERTRYRRWHLSQGCLLWYRTPRSSDPLRHPGQLYV